MMAINKNRFKGFAFVMLAAFVYGLQGVLARSVLVAGVAPIVMTGIKLLSGLVTVAILVIVLRKKLHFDKKDLPHWIVFGVVGGTLFALTLINSYNILGASQGVIYMYTAPAFTVLIAHFYLKEIITRAKLIAVILVIAGTVSVAVGAIGSSFSFNLVGFLFGISSGITYAVFSVMGKKLSRKYDSWSVNFFYILIATLAIAPAFPFFDWGILLGQDIKLLLLICLYGFLVYGVGNYFFMKSMNYLEAGEVMIFANTEPVIGLVLAAIILNERLMPLQIAGFIFILVAIFLIAKSDKSYVSLEG